jgi:hypothetical protein
MQQHDADWTVLGFDLRVGPLIGVDGVRDLTLVDPNDRQGRFPYPATISETVWPRASGLCDNSDRLNAFNLFFLPDFTAEPGIDLSKTISVAFCILSSDRELLVGCQPPPSCSAQMLLSTRGWSFAGFDIVDKYATFSGWYGFNWKAGELATNDSIRTATFNLYGLISDFQVANSLCAEFDKLVPAHASFYPIQVFVQDPNRK